MLELSTIKAVYLHGHKHPELISPDNWNMDLRFMERPNARRVQMDLFYDYRTNVTLYPKWQSFLREHQPKTLIFWGQDDIFFTRQGGEAYLSDLPNAEIHRLDSGHFAVEDSLDVIATNIRRFCDEKVATDSTSAKPKPPKAPKCANLGQFELSAPASSSGALGRFIPSGPRCDCDAVEREDRLSRERGECVAAGDVPSGESSC